MNEWRIYRLTDRYIIDDRYRKMIDGSMDFKLVKVLW